VYIVREPNENTVLGLTLIPLGLDNLRYQLSVISYYYQIGFHGNYISKKKKMYLLIIY
jgi:hypothetical protein